MKTFILVVSILLSSKSFAANCCGTNFSAPALITTAEKYKIQIGQSFSRKEFQALEESKNILLKDHELTSKTQIKFGMSFNESFQGFLSTSKTHQLMGDTDLGIGHNTIDEAEEKLFTWVSGTIPTGKSIDQLSSSSEEPSGAGYSSLTTGALYSHIYSWGDASTTATFGKGFPRDNFIPGYHANVSAGMGRSIEAFRYGIQFDYQYLQGKRTNDNLSLDSYWGTMSLQFSYSLGDSLIGLTYSDETLLGPAQNAYLTRALNMSYIFRKF